MPPGYHEGGDVVSNEDREKQAMAWLERLREVAAGKQSLVEYCRRHGLRPGEAYQWKRNLRSSGRWPWTIGGRPPDPLVVAAECGPSRDNRS
jgi:hypothetical protein